MSTELNLVNATLRAIGQEPVVTLEDPSIDTLLAQTVVNESNEDLQLKDWWFNEGLDDIVALEDLPRQAVAVVRKMAQIKATIDLDFDANKAQAVASDLQPLLAMLERQDLNQRSTNVYKSPTVEAFMSGITNVGGCIDPLGGGENV